MLHRLFLAGDIDAQRDDDAVGPHVHAVEQQHGEVELGERGGPPGVELCLRLGHEPPTHVRAGPPLRAKSLGMRDKAGQSGTNGCASGTNISCPPSFCSRT